MAEGLLLLSIAAGFALAAWALGQIVPDEYR